MERRRISVDGICQGVGFRPFVHGLAARLGLRGWVRNGPHGVTIDVEGRPAELDAFRTALEDEPPAPAVVDEIRVERRDPARHSGFRILPSRPGAERRIAVPPDVATCDACLEELADPDDRRHGYPFLSCTHCGPRFTLIRDLPYDRASTTMARFTMCEECRREYEDPADRRFHAQPAACPACGPTAAFRETPDAATSSDEPVAAAAAAIRSGRIVAVKGVGGFHLACDAGSPAAVAELRERKGRPAKPFAVLVPEPGAAGAICRLGPREERALSSPRRPIVLLARRPGTGERVAPEVAPGLDVLGLMLPYTPLHRLLVDAVGGPIVLTSGNRSGEPIVYRDDEARDRLGPVADAFLTHDRPIEAPCDDSVVRVLAGRERAVRRSRGHAPRPVRLAGAAPAPVLAVGGHLKNTFCLVRSDRAFLSQHVGDLEDYGTYRRLEEGVAHFRRLLGVRPAVVAHDLHPDYLSTRLARELARDEEIPRIGVQHHHAHLVSCLAEHGEGGPAIGVAFDGTGYGPDGAVWGGEFLLGDLREFRREGHLAYRPLPGGEAAVREPWRMALSHLEAAGIGDSASVGEVDPWRRDAVLQLLASSTAAPATSSVGRLFDAAAALAGVRSTADYEAQAAMELEGIADPAVSEEAYPVAFGDGADGGPWTWDPGPLVAALVDDVRRGVAAPSVAARFHNAVRDAVVAGCERIRDDRGVVRVALTGGVFQNALLVERTRAALEDEGFVVLLHRRVPPNDGGLALGQAAVAAARLPADPGGRSAARRPAAADSGTGEVPPETGEKVRTAHTRAR